MGHPVYDRETKVSQPVYFTYMNWLLYMKIFALLSWVLIFAYFSLLFQNITTYSLEIWVQRLKPKLCGMPSRPLGKYRKSTTIHHIFTTAYYVLYILYHNEVKAFITMYALLPTFIFFFSWKPTAQKLDTRP